MKLTDGDRLILSLLYTVLEKIDPNEAEDYASSREIVVNGFTKYYDNLNASLGAEISDDVQGKVLNILDMHRAMDNAFKNLGPESGIEADDIQFKGFDGNNETDHYSFLRFLHKMGRYEESPLENIHHTSLPFYQRQLDAWNNCPDRFELRQEDVEAIIAAKVHPDHQEE